MLNSAKAGEQGRCALMGKPSAGGILQQHGAGSVAEAKLAWELAVNIMENREFGQSLEQSNVAGGEGPAEMDRARQFPQLENYLRRNDPDVEQDVLGSINSGEVP